MNEHPLSITETHKGIEIQVYYCPSHVTIYRNRAESLNLRVDEVETLIYLLTEIKNHMEKIPEAKKNCAVLNQEGTHAFGPFTNAFAHKVRNHLNDRGGASSYKWYVQVLDSPCGVWFSDFEGKEE